MVVLYPTLTDPERSRNRKMLECIFRGTGIKCLVYVQEGLAKENGRRDKVARDTEAIVVKEEGKTYVDLLKTAKERIVPGSIEAKGIRTIREGRNGQMVIVMDKGEKESITALRESLKVSDRTIIEAGKKRSDQRAISIKEIDALTTKDEVIEAVSKELGIPKDECRIRSLRPYFRRNQAVTAHSDKERAAKLLLTGKTRIVV